ncbi:MAG: Hsp20/alpha crystallin family protein [Bacteroidetes bacterium]|nr:Hsp20/alpha crystallin family protein [Bacteroidota bacterium]
MKSRQKSELQALPNESIILADQGFIKNNNRSGWKPGHLSLTNQRLVLHQPSRNIFETSLDSIESIETEKKGFILKSVDVLSLAYKHSSNGGLSRVWIMVKNPDQWQKEIFNHTKRCVTEKDVENVVSELDEKSRKILLHIWDKRHASIRDLTAETSAPNHMAVLNMIRKQINPVSEKLNGFPLLVFERSKVDPVTGEKVLFNWWLIGDEQWGKSREDFLLMDLFDEGSYISLIAELNGVLEKDIGVKVEDDKLNLHYISNGQNYSEDFLLNSKVKADSLEQHYHNGILEVIMEKEIMGE